MSRVLSLFVLILFVTSPDLAVAQKETPKKGATSKAKSKANATAKGKSKSKSKSSETATADWPAWRGPNGNGVAAPGQTLPTKWSETENIIWKTPVPGRGHSSPTVVGDQIFLTTADVQSQTQSLLAFDRETGQAQWAEVVNQGGLAPEIHAKNTHATPTAAVQDGRVFVVFSNHNSAQLSAYTVDGKQLWQKVAGPFQPKAYQFGYAPSPLLYGDTVIVSSEFEAAPFLAAFDQKTGKEVWRIARPNNISFSSPIIAKLGGQDQLLISGSNLVSSYDPKNGKPRWQAETDWAACCGTIVWDGNLVFASGGYPDSQTLAVESNNRHRVVWSNRDKSYEQSLLAHNGLVYAFNDNGIAMCWDAKTGEEQWKQRLGGPVSSSPILAGDHIYAANEAGTMFVFKPNPEAFELVAENQLGDEGFPTIAACGNRIYLRTADNSSGRQEYLYCIGLK